MEEENKKPRIDREDPAEFFVSELAALTIANDNRYTGLSHRIARLEKMVKPKADDPFEYLGTVVIIIIAIQALPYIMELIQAWKHPTQKNSLTSPLSSD